jgi:hypothetical protein
VAVLVVIQQDKQGLRGLPIQAVEAVVVLAVVVLAVLEALALSSFATQAHLLMLQA